MKKPQLQLHAIVNLRYESLSCTVRCLAGTVRMGDPVELRLAGADRPLVEGLTVSAIEYAGRTPMDFIDLGRTGLVTVTGHPLDAAAIRAIRVVAPKNTPGRAVPADLRLIALTPTR